MDLLIQPPKAYYQGIEEFNQQRFFECHETLEELWRAEPTELRRLYQGILQIGVGFYHATVRQNYWGATRLLTTGIDWLEPFLPVTFDTDLASLTDESRRTLAYLRELGPANIQNFERSFIPKIKVTTQHRDLEA